MTSKTAMVKNFENSYGVKMNIKRLTNQIWHDLIDQAIEFPGEVYSSDDKLACNIIIEALRQVLREAAKDTCPACKCPDQYDKVVWIDDIWKHRVKDETHILYNCAAHNIYERIRSMS